MLDGEGVEFGEKERKFKGQEFSFVVASYEGNEI